MNHIIELGEAHFVEMNHTYFNDCRYDVVSVPFTAYIEPNISGDDLIRIIRICVVTYRVKSGCGVISAIRVPARAMIEKGIMDGKVVRMICGMFQLSDNVGDDV